MEKEYKDTIELISNVTDAYTAILFLKNDTSDALKVAAWHTLSKDFDPDCEISPGDGVVDLVYKKQKPINISLLERDNGDLLFYKKDVSIKSFMAVPVGRKGVLWVDSKSTYDFVEKDQKILMEFANTFLHLIKSKEIKLREKEYAKMLKLLYQVDHTVRQAKSPGAFLDNILNEMKLFSRADICFFTSLRSSRKDFKIDAAVGVNARDLIGNQYKISEGLIGWVYRKKQPLVIKSRLTDSRKSYIFKAGDPARGFRSFIGLPMIMWGEIVGVAGLACYDPNEWTTDEIQVLTMTGQWVASIIGTLTI